MRKFLIPILVLLASCAPYAEMRSPDRIQVQLDRQTYNLIAPSGYCFDRATLQKRQGWVDPELQVVEVIASDCVIKNGKGIPTELTHVLTYGLSPSTSTIEDQAAEIKASLQIDGNMKGDYFQFKTEDANRNDLNGMVKIRNAILLIRVTTIGGNDSADPQEILETSIEATRQAN